MGKLTPIESEFSTTEESEAHDAWVRVKVAASLADPAPPVPHETVMADLDRLIEEAEQRLGAG